MPVNRDVDPVVTGEVEETRAAGSSAPACSPVTIEQMIGGGDSWYYALQNEKVLGAAHRDDLEAMQRLYDIQKANAPRQTPSEAR